MAFFRRTFSRRLLPDRFQEISERVYVFDCCLSTKEMREEEYKSYMDVAVTNLQKYHPGASFMVFNFKEGDNPSVLFDLLSQYEMTVVDYPRDYEGYPILPLEMIHYFLRSSESWLSLEGQRNVILMHCERGCWPVLAFMLAGFLLYNKKQIGEQKTLDIVYKYAPKELLMPLSSVNPRSSQLRYLQYISNRSLTSDWPPPDAPLLIESVLFMNLPLFDGGKGCRPVVHIYGQDPSVKTNRTPRLLFSSLMSQDGARYYHKEECLVVNINVKCCVQGDIFMECNHLGEDLVSETKMFKAMFHTAFVESYVLVLNSSEVDVLWNPNTRIPDDLKAEVFFANPEEVPLRIVKEVASLVEEGHESESEFFEAQEYDVFVLQDHNNDNVKMQDDLVATRNDATLHPNEETHLDHHNESKQEKLDVGFVKSTETDDDIRNQLEGKIATLEENLVQKSEEKLVHILGSSEASFDDKAKHNPNNEPIVSREWKSKEAEEVDNAVVHHPSDEEDSYRHVREVDFHPSLDDYEASTENANIMEANGSKVQDSSRTSLVVSSSEAEFMTCVALKPKDKQSSEEAPEVANDHNPNNVRDRDTNVDFHLSVKGTNILDDCVADVANDNILEVVNYTEAKALVDVENADIGTLLDVVNSDQEDVVVVDEISKDSSTSASLQANAGLGNADKSFLIPEKSLKDSSQTPNSSEAQFEPNIIVEGSEYDPIIVSANIVVTQVSEDGSKTCLPKDTYDEISCNLIITEADSSKVGFEELRLSNAGRYFDTTEGSQEESEDCSEISCEEIESKNCNMMSNNSISLEGSGDSSEVTSLETRSKFVAQQAKQKSSSEAGSEVNSATSKNVVVVIEDSEEQDVKVQVQPKSVDGGSKSSVNHKMKNKSKQRLVDAVNKVTMQKRVVSMWVPRTNQPSLLDDNKHKAPVYKWVPKVPTSTSEEA